MELFYLLYQSVALIPNEDAEHDRILTGCQKNNAANEVTGFLHREGDYFIQYLEGTQDRVEETLARIAKDPRHRDVQVLDSGTLKQRRLPDWQMGFVDGDQLSLADLLEVSDGQLDLKTENPFDLIVFMAANAESLRSTAS